MPWAVLYSRIAYKRLDDWHGYFLTTSVGASGLAFAIQVCYALTHVCMHAASHHSSKVFQQCVLEPYTAVNALVLTSHISWQSQRAKILVSDVHSDVMPSQASRVPTKPRKGAHVSSRHMLASSDVGQVMDDHKRFGLANVLEVAAIPVQFRCWPQLLLAQLMLPTTHVSFTGHLCGIFAGLLHVYLPKAGTALQCPLVLPLVYTWVWDCAYFDAVSRPVTRCCSAV